MSDILSFLSFDVEALPGRSAPGFDPIEKLIWGREGGQEAGIIKICQILDDYGIKANFMIELGASLAYEDRKIKAVVDFLKNKGHDVHAHLHSEALLRLWRVKYEIPAARHFDVLDEKTAESILKFSFEKMRILTGEEPKFFRAGAYLFNRNLVVGAKKAGYIGVTNFNSTRFEGKFEANLIDVKRNEPFYWENGLLELPVDFSPEPLTYKWDTYLGMFHRAADHKTIKTFNLVNHSWSLMKREGNFMTNYETRHEEGLRNICEHLLKNTVITTYSDFTDKLKELLIHTTEKENIIDLNKIDLPLKDSFVSKCNICLNENHFKLDNDICPGCGSRARHRQLKNYLESDPNFFKDKIVLANYANTIEKNIILNGAKKIINFDVRPVSECDFQMDIQSMDKIEDESVDVFFALHVLNHVKNDDAALREIYRVIKSYEGFAILSLPYRQNSKTVVIENISEHYGVDNLEKFGVGTYRIYGFEDFINQASNLFFVELLDGIDSIGGSEMKIFKLIKKH